MLGPGLLGAAERGKNDVLQDLDSGWWLSHPSENICVTWWKKCSKTPTSMDIENKTWGLDWMMLSTKKGLMDISNHNIRVVSMKDRNRMNRWPLGLTCRLHTPSTGLVSSVEHHTFWHAAVQHGVIRTYLNNFEHIWWFPEIGGTPSHHPFQIGIFPKINHLAIGVPP